MEKFDVIFEPTKTHQKYNKTFITHSCEFSFPEQTKPIIVSKIIIKYDEPINVINLLDSSFKLGKRHIYGFKEILFATVFYKCLLYKRKCKITDTEMIIKPFNMCINSFVSVFDSRQTTEYIMPSKCRFKTNENISIKIVIETTDANFSHSESDQCDLEKTVAAYRILNPFNGVYFGEPRFIATTQKNDEVDIINMSYTIDVSDSLSIKCDNHIVTPCDMIIKKIGDYKIYFIPLQFIKDQTLNFMSIHDITDLLKSKYLLDQPCTGLTDINISTDPPNVIESCHIICIEA
jgi:hypothetical protein